jgi:hypothetical protein
VVRREPRVLGYAQSRWTLDTIGQACDWLNVTTQGGLSRLLHRLKIHYKRGRDYIHSPDPYYEDKCALIELCRLRALYDPQRYVFLYLDECTYYRQPTLSRDYELSGGSQPLARRSYQANTWFHIVAALDALSGRVVWQQRSKIGLRQLGNFYVQIRQTYPLAEEIYVVQDNWPVHFHPDVLAYLQPQNLPWPPKLSWTWPKTARPGIIPMNLPIQILCLPTYASWLNPIEKLWRWLKQQLLHHHRYSNDWPALRQLVADFFNQFQTGSEELLTYVGLLPT